MISAPTASLVAVELSQLDAQDMASQVSKNYENPEVHDANNVAFSLQKDEL